MNSAQLIHFHLRDDIISMRRRPGEPIAEKDITQIYQVSRTPVREALLRLSEEGLIDIIAKSGTIVSRIPADELPEAILARKAIEQMTARMAAELAAKSDVLKLSAIVERQKEALRSNDIDGFHDEDEALHRSIMAAAGLPGIWRFVEGIKVQLDRFRRLTLPQAHRMERGAGRTCRVGRRHRRRPCGKSGDGHRRSPRLARRQPGQDPRDRPGLLLRKPGRRAGSLGQTIVLPSCRPGDGRGQPDRCIGYRLACEAHGNQEPRGRLNDVKPARRAGGRS